MSKVKLGINGFWCFRESFRDNVEVVAINDLLDVEHLAYLLNTRFSSWTFCRKEVSFRRKTFLQMIKTSNYS
jgi:glyceraldehyde-3-phosphate dehydrogenase/erythrose-4-phosphate dehydrogenase